jgi:hypothetical protein
VNFRKLDVCHVAVRFLPLAASIADSLPPRYAALADQLRRASISRKNGVVSAKIKILRELVAGNVILPRFSLF